MKTIFLYKYDRKHRIYHQLVIDIQLNWILTSAVQTISFCVHCFSSIEITENENDENESNSGI